MRVKSFLFIAAILGPSLVVAQATPTSQPSPGLQGDDYTTVLHRPDGSNAMQFDYTVATIGGLKKSLIKVGDKKAILVQDPVSGSTTLYLPATNESFRGPKPKDKEPQTTIEYFTLAYANAAAPKPKKNNLLGSIGGNILGGAVQNLGSQMITGAILSGLGQASAPVLMNAAIQNMGGYAVQEFAVELGRAVMTSAKPTDASGPEVVNSTVKVKDKVYAETAFKQRHAVNEADFAGNDANIKDVDAKELYKQFATFMASGMPK